MTYIFNPLTGNLEFNSVPNNSITTSKLATPIAPILSSLNGGPLAGNRNRIINGAMHIDQRNNGQQVEDANGYIVDRWAVTRGGTGRLTAQRITTTGRANIFYNLLRVSVSTSTLPDATDLYQIYQPIEGFNAFDLLWGTADAIPITISFWARSSIIGTYAISVVSYGNFQSYVGTYNINQANTFEYKTITIPGPTSGTWSINANGWGFLIFDLGSGSNTITTAGSWQTGNFRKTSSCVNLISTQEANFSITGVQLEAGTQATPFEQRFINQELSLCQRYYYVSPSDITIQVPSAGTMTVPITFPSMRITPTGAFVGTPGLSNVSSCSINSISNGAFMLQVNSQLAGGFAFGIRFSAAAEL